MGAMSKRLIITEKPSVARDLVRALGGMSPMQGGQYWEGPNYLCTFAVGHLLSLLEPQDLNPRWRVWDLHTLPIIPDSYGLKPVAQAEPRLELIRQLAARADVSGLINACDAAREGELIFREIVAYLQLRLPVQRLWLQSLTPEAIRTAMDRLRSGAELQGLAQAAACRAKADWLIGMNATRAYTLRLRQGGPASEQGVAAWSVGRVQTPTLALLVERELAILAHQSRPYWRLKATFQASDHVYEGHWYDPKARSPKAQDPGGPSSLPQGRHARPPSPPGMPEQSSAAPTASDDRLYEFKVAQAHVDAIRQQAGQAREIRDQTERAAPPLFHLTGLQRAMATRYRWSAKRTLDTAQRCYETHKVITYPRTGSQCLPEDHQAVVREVLAGFAQDPSYGRLITPLLREGFHNIARVFDDSGVSDHFAIIPTGKTAKLSGDDAKLFDAVMRRLLAALYPKAIMDRVRRYTEVAGLHFRTGPLTTVAVAGWLAVGEPDEEQRRPGSKSVLPLPPLRQPGVQHLESRLSEEQTKPPPRYGEAALLGLMEHAGRHIEDQELKAVLERTEGLGTPATRADIIQNLKAKAYVDDDLRPSFKGIHLIEVLRQVGAVRLTSAELTAQLEQSLAQVEQGRRSADAFMDEVGSYVREVVGQAKAYDRRAAAREPIANCRFCGQGKLMAEDWRYLCPQCNATLPREVAGRYLDAGTVRQLMEHGETPALEGWGGKGKAAALAFREGTVLVQTVRADGSLQELSLADYIASQGASQVARAALKPTSRPAAASKDRPPSAGSSGKVLGPCPVHAGQQPACEVIETARTWMCRTRLAQWRAGHESPDGVFLPKTLCGLTLSSELASAFLKEGVTPLLDGLLSKSGKPFKARILRGPSGAWSFDFEKRG